MRLASVGTVRKTQHHPLRTSQSTQTREYPDGHDMGMTQAVEKLFGGFTREATHQVWAHQFPSLLVRLGALGVSRSPNVPSRVLGFLG